MIGFFGLALAMADPAPAPPKPLGVQSLAGLFSANDYPRDAADRNEQGRVQVIVHVDAQGAVSSCEIKESSGFPSLDTRTCEIIAQRARFLPARDSAGHDVPSETTQSVVWALDNGPSFMPSEAWGTSMILDFGPDRQPGACRMESTGFTRGTTPETCPPDLVTGVARSAFPGIPDGTTSMVASTDFRLGPAAPVTLGPGEVLMERSVAEIAVDEGGHRVACKQTEAEGPLIHADDLCGQDPGIPYKVRTGADGKPVPFTATIATTMIARVGVPAAR